MVTLQLQRPEVLRTDSSTLVVVPEPDVVAGRRPKVLLLVGLVFVAVGVAGFVVRRRRSASDSEELASTDGELGEPGRLEMAGIVDSQAAAIAAVG